MTLPQHGHPSIIRLGGIFGLGLLRVVVGFELHDGTGKVLSQAIMDFIGNQLSFMVAGLQQMSKSQSSNQTFACARRRDMRFIIVRRIIASLVSGLRS